MAEQSISIKDRYFELLTAYVTRPEESYLLEAADLGRELVLAGVSPEDIGEIHEQALDRLAQERPDMTLLDAARLISAPLMELLMAYSLAFRERLEERKRAMEALRESEERLSAFMDSAPDCFTLFDSELNFVDVNDAALEFFPTGTKKEDLIGKNILDVVPGLEETGRYDSYLEVIKTGKPFYVEDVVPHPKFGDRRLTVRAFKVDEGLGLIVTDITERKRAEEAVRRSEQRYRSLFEGLPVGLYRMTPQGLILHANPALVQMLGYPDWRALMAVNALDLYVNPEDFERQQALLGREGIARDFEMQFRRYDGTVIWVRNTVQAVRSDRRDVFYHEGSLEDITERKRAEEALRESEEKYRDLVERANDGITIVQDTLLKYVNPRLAEITGYTTEEMIDTPFTKYIHPDELPKVIDRYERRMAGEDVTPVYETALRHRDRGRIDVEFNAGMITYQEKPADFVFVRDITERVRAEESLRRSEERYRAVVEYQTDLICRFLPDSTLTFVNQAYCRYHGKQREELVGHSLMPLILPEDREKAAQYLASFSQATPVATIEYRAVAAGGKVRCQYWINRPVFDEQGRLIEFQSVGRDITERRRAEEERDRLLAQVQEQAQQMQQIMDTVPEGVLLLDAEGRVVLANPVAEGDLAVLAGAKVGDTLTHLGDRPLAELLARPPRGIWHEVATDDRHFEVIARPVEAGPPTGGACPGPALSAAEGPALSTAEGACPETVEGWVLVIRDVTQEREVQRCIQQQERLAAVGQLAAGIAHDFNNIMATIVLYAQMMMRTEERSSQDRERLVTIDQQARHAAHLTQQILDFSRRAMLDRRPLDLLPFLKESLKLLERTLPENIELELAYGRDEYVVNADPTRVQQAVMNLALNARDAMPEGGNLRIGLERIRVGLDESLPLPEMALRQAQGAEPGEWVRVTVSDTGTGIPPEVLPHVFEPFFTTKPVGQGSGLGLAQVYGIVKQHEGEIGVKSQVGHGTTFTFYLPALPVSAPEPLAQEMEPLAFGHGETILVVEDDPSVREALSDTLETLDYRVLNAANGQEALEVYRVARSGDRPQQGVDLVLTDLVMPGMGGRELMRELRKMDPRVKGLAVTGYAVSEDLREEGIVEVVEKPFDVDTLAEAVRRALAAF